MKSKNIMIMGVVLTLLLVFGSQVVLADDVVAEEEEFVIGWSNASIGNPWRIEMVERATRRLEEMYPQVTMYVTHAQDSVSRQISDAEDLLARDIDLLMLSPASMDGLNVIVDRAKNQGIPCVVVQRETSNRDFTALVWNDDKQLGALSGLEAARIMGHEGRVGIIEGFAGAPSTMNRNVGIKHSLELYPDIEVVAQLPGDYQEARARSVMEDILLREPDIDAMIIHSGTMARGALSAIRAEGRAGDIKIITIGSENHVLKEIARGNMHSTVMETVGVGADGIDKAMKVLQGEDFNKLFPTLSPIVTPLNVEEWVEWDWDDDTWVW